MAELWTSDEAGEISCHDEKFDYTEDNGEPLTKQKTDVVNFTLKKQHFGGEEDDTQEGYKTQTYGSITADVQVRDGMSALGP